MKVIAALGMLVVLALLAYVYLGKQKSATDTGSGGTVPPASDGLWAMLNGIYFFEGPGPRDRNNNPGNLKAKSSGVLWPGQIGTDPKGFAIFPDMTTGMEALKGRVSELSAKHPEWDFYDFFSYYLTGSTTGPTSTKEGDSDRYADFVADKIGVDPTTPVAEAIGG